MSSRPNKLIHAIRELYRSHLPLADFVAIWNDPALPKKSSGIGFSYNDNLRPYGAHARVIRDYAKHQVVRAPKTLTTDNALTMYSRLLAASVKWQQRTHDGIVRPFAEAALQGSTWSDSTVYVWTAYVMEMEWSATIQRHKLQELGLPTHNLVACPLTQALIPAQFTKLASVIGEQKRIVAMSNGTLWDNSLRTHPLNQGWLFYANSYLPILIGWVPQGTELVNIVTDRHRLQGVPLISAVMTAFPHICHSCNHRVSLADLIENTNHEITCNLCVSQGSQETQVKSYNDNVLKYLTVQVSLKKPFKMPDTPVKWLTPILMGCELEYNCADNTSLAARLMLLQHLKDFVIFKHDGTLNSGGFEIVTVPADIAMHKQKFQPVFENFPPQLQLGPNVGMHIHLDRNALSPLMLGRMTEFMHNPDNKGFIETVGERPLNSYCAQQAMGYANVLSGASPGRYGTLNLVPKKTVEFRIFYTPVTYAQFVKNLEFVLGLLQFYRTGMTNITPKAGNKYQAFLDYLKLTNRSKLEARNENHYLMQFLKEKQVL